MASHDFGDDVFLAPAQGGSLATVTLPMLEDFLSDCEVVHRPPAARRTFRWFAAVSHEMCIRDRSGAAWHDMDSDPK